MKIVIDISEEEYELVRHGNEFPLAEIAELMNAIIKGTPLPENHGRLIIISEDKIKEDQLAFLSFNSCQKWISEVGLSNATVAIIEAERE